jgi:hypothetical protein
MPDEPLSTPLDGHIVWLSGAFLTFMRKVVMPAAWFALLIGIPAWVYATVTLSSSSGSF